MFVDTQSFTPVDDLQSCLKCQNILYLLTAYYYIITFLIIYLWMRARIKPNSGETFDIYAHAFITVTHKPQATTFTNKLFKSKYWEPENNKTKISVSKKTYQQLNHS